MAVHSTLLPTLQNTSITSTCVATVSAHQNESKHEFLDLVLVLDEALDRLEVSLDHLTDKTWEIDFALPAEQSLSFGRVAEEEAIAEGTQSETKVMMKRMVRDVLDFSRTEILGINLDNDLSGLHINTFLFDTFAPPSAIAPSARTINGV